MFEMLGLFDDALIQYDELDALFTQFVLNHASGGNTPPTCFCIDIIAWDFPCMNNLIRSRV